MKKHNPDLLRYLGSILLSCFLVLAIAPKSYTQVPDKAGTIAYLNSLGGDTLRFKLSGSKLVVELHREDKMIRQDQVVVADLDTAARYETASGLVCMNCLPDVEGCVTRELLVQKIKRPYNRISFSADENAAGKYALALEHLVKIMSVKNYRDEIILP